MNKISNIGIAALAVAFAAGTIQAETPDKWVRYVEATGSQYVDTGIVGRWNTKVECQVEWMGFGDKVVLGSGDWSDNTRFFVCYCRYDDGTIATAQGSSPDLATINTSWNPRWEKNRVYNYTVEFTAKDDEQKSTRKVSVDGIKFQDVKSAAIDTNSSLFMFSLNRKGSAYSGSNAKARIYRMKIWQGPENGGAMTLVRDFQPCMKGGKVGLYDAVSEAIFYSNSGTDLVCDENSEVPDEFIEYVESQGDAALDASNKQYPAYIDTGVIGRSGTKAAGEFALLASEDKGLLGSRKGDDRFYLMQNYKSSITCGYGLHKENNQFLAPEKKYWVETELNAGSQTERIGSDGSTNTVHSGNVSTVYDTTYPLYLFCCNVNGKADWFSKARCYGLKIWQDGVLVRDFRPCLKNGVAGLYDDVSKRIFYSSATPLAFNNVHRTSVKPKEVVFVEYIESDGSNTLDTGVPARSGIRAKGEMAWMTEGDYNDGKLRIWNHESYRYLEETAAVFWRQKRAYLGARCITDSVSWFNMIHESDSKLKAQYGNSGELSASSGGSDVALYATTNYSFDVIFANGLQTIEWNGTQVLNKSIDGPVDSGDTLHLFSSSHWRWRSAARCYGLKLWQDGTLVRDFKPCLVDGKGMLYDTVTKSIYRPSPDIPASRTGTIVFSGEEKPAQYVEYVESDGTIYVDTGVCGKSGTAAEVKMAFLEKSDCGFLDARAGGNRFYLLHNNTKDDNKMLYGYGGTAPAIGQAEVGTVYTVSSSLATGAQTISVDGTQRINATDAAAIDTGLNLYLFTCNWNGYPNWNGKARLYYLKLHQGNADGSNMQLVRNLKPVRLTNGLVVLWDFASKKPYAARSVTSGKFVEFSKVGPLGAKISEGTTIILR